VNFKDSVHTQVAVQFKELESMGKITKFLKFGGSGSNFRLYSLRFILKFGKVSVVFKFKGTLTLITTEHPKVKILKF